MNEHIKQTKEAANKVVEEQDERLKEFFHCDEKSQGAIFEELKYSTEEYSNFKEIAAGGMKQIYSVWNHSSGRTVAMAKLYKEASEGMIEPFLREARLTARLDHPNIIKIHDIGLTDDQKPYFTMDLKSGKSLKKTLETKQDGLRELLIVFMKICDAVSYAHSKGVLHLDLKPDNIQIGKFGEVIVCDWGLGKIIDEKNFSDEEISSDVLNGMTLHGTIKGTPGFMAPEQVNDQAKDYRTDLYSLGAILYNILTGKKPFNGTVDEILKQTVFGEVEPPSKKSPQAKVPRSLEAIVLKSMGKSPQKRYSTVANMADDIRAYLAGFATDAENAGLVKLFSLMVKRNKALSCVTFLAIFLITFSTIFFIRSIQQEKAVAISERDRANNLSLAEQKARSQVESAAKLIEKEKAELKKLNNEYVSTLTLQSVFVSDNINHWDVYDKKIYTNTLQQLDKAIELNVKSAQTWAQKAVLLMIMQEYSMALKALEKAPEINFLAQTCTLGKTFKKQMTASNFVKLLEMVNDLNQVRSYRKAMIDKMIAYDQNVNNRSVSEKLIITRALIRVWNTGWKGELLYETNLRKMTLTGKKLSILRTTVNKLTTKQNILRLIKPLSLQFIGTGVKNLSYMKDMPLKELDIRGTKIKVLKELNQLKHLSILIVNEGQFSDRQLKLVPTWIELKVK
jgi:serine/threonine protein kinase